MTNCCPGPTALTPSKPWPENDAYSQRDQNAISPEQRTSAAKDEGEAVAVQQAPISAVLDDVQARAPPASDVQVASVSLQSEPVSATQESGVGVSQNELALGSVLDEAIHQTIGSDSTASDVSGLDNQPAQESSSIDGVSSGSGSGAGAANTQAAEVVAIAVDGLADAADFRGAASFNQIFYLSLDGASGVSYNGPVTVANLDIPAFTAPVSLAGQEGAILQALLARLQDAFTGTGVQFVTQQPATGPYSTVYVGGDDAAFGAWSRYYGLAEKTDLGNADPTDKAFVFSTTIPAAGVTAAQYGDLLAGFVAHEALHLLGHGHDGAAGDPLAAVAAIASTFEPNPALVTATDVNAVPIANASQTETNIAINPANPANLVVMANGGTAAGAPGSSDEFAAVSVNSGAGFAIPAPPPPLAAALGNAFDGLGNAAGDNRFDGAAAFDAFGNLHVIYMHRPPVGNSSIV